MSTGRYTFTQLQGWVNDVENDPGLQDLEVTTSEPWTLYLNQGQSWQYPELMTLGDFAFPNFHPYFDNDPQWHSDPTNAAKLLHDNWDQWFKNNTNPVILKESWWPSALSNPANESESSETCFASQTNQTAYFSALTSYSDVYFVWGEAQDVAKQQELINWCKSTNKDAARHWGLWTVLNPSDAKNVVGSIDLGTYA